MGDWVVEIEMDKVHLTREQFAAKHGHMFVYIYDEQLAVVYFYENKLKEKDNE